MQSRNLDKIIVLGLGLVLAFGRVCAQNWVVPDDKMQKVSPMKFDAAAAQKGADVFKKNCMSCHGEPTKANFAGLTPSPGDPATDKFQKQTDGALFHKITTGRSLMPEFKNLLSEEERWQVIAYFRSFNKSYIQPEPASVPSGKYGGMEIVTNAEFLSSQKLIKVTLVGVKNKESVPVAGVSVQLYARRYFGDLQIDETKTSNEKGEVLFDYKDALPGDTAGEIKFVVKINADGLDGVKKETPLKVGTKLTAPSLIEGRNMWSIRSNAPLWLILAYSLAVIGVWSGLIYIVLKIGDIRKIGKSQAPDSSEEHKN
jgi:mono/diheme cytochrome c family protein